MIPKDDAWTEQANLTSADKKPKNDRLSTTKKKRKVNHNLASTKSRNSLNPHGGGGVFDLNLGIGEPLRV